MQIRLLSVQSRGNVLHKEVLPFLCSDINKITNAIADQVSIFIERLSTFVFGFMVGFIGGWKLTLVVIAVSPLIGLAAALMAMVREASYGQTDDFLQVNGNESLSYVVGPCLSVTFCFVAAGCGQADRQRTEGLCKGRSSG